MQINVFSKSEWIQRINDWEADAADKLGVRNSASRRVLNDVAQHRDRVWIRPVLFDFRSYSFDFSSRTINHIHIAPGKENDSDKKDNSNLIAFLGACVMGATVATFAYMLSKYNRSNAGIKNTESILENLPSQRAINPRDVFSKIHELASLRFNIEKREHNRITKYLLSSAITFIGGAALFAGAYTLTPALVTAGTVITLAGSLFATFTFFFHLEDSTLDAACYREITGYRVGRRAQQGLAEAIKVQLLNYDEDMNLNVQPEGHEGYSPMFSSTELPRCGNTQPSAPDWEPQVEGQ